ESSGICRRMRASARSGVSGRLVAAMRSPPCEASIGGPNEGEQARSVERSWARARWSLGGRERSGAGTMSRRVVILDGYNLIMRVPQLAPGAGRTLAEAREKLVNLLRWAVGSGNADFIVVFDGARGFERALGGRVSVRFSRPPEKADDVIRRLVEEQVERGLTVTVVTADLEVARHARAMGADVALSDLFIASLLGPPGAKGAAGQKPSHLPRNQ